MLVLKSIGRSLWLLLLILVALLLPPPLAQARETWSFTLADLGKKDIRVTTVFDQVQLHFPLPEGRQVWLATFRVHLSHDKKLLPERSDLTIALNDEPAINLPLTPDNAKANWVYVPLPVEALRPGDNVLTLRFDLRLRDRGCKDVGSPDLWARVRSDSRLEFEGRDAPLRPDLARFPAPFATLTSLGSGPGLSIVLPSRPTPAELTAAVRIAAALGKAANWPTPPLQATTVDQLDGAQAAADHLIVVDSGGRNPLAAGVAPGLSEQPSPYNPNRLMLVVSGEDETALLQAANVLATRSARSQLQGAHSPPVPVVAHPLPVRPTRATFAELGFEDRRVRGIGPHDLYYPIDVPYEWKVTSEAAIALRFSHARGLDSSTSLMSAYVNGFEVADVPLTARNAADGRLVVQLSPRQVRPGRNWLHLVFDLHKRREDCNFRYLEEAWANVSAGDSTLNLAHVESQPPLDLRYLPSPLVTPADLSAALFVLPTRPTAAELRAMVRLAAKLGTYADADGLRPSATTAAHLAGAAPEAHVVAIGSPDSHTLLAEYDSWLPQPLALVDGAVEATGGRDLLPEEVVGQAGYIQILPAPWSPDKALVVVSAPDGERLGRVVDVWPTMGRRWKVWGNVALVTPDGVRGLTIGGLADAPLAAPIRRLLSLILLGTTVVMGGAGLLISRGKRIKMQELKNASE